MNPGPLQQKGCHAMAKPVNCLPTLAVEAFARELIRTLLHRATVCRCSPADFHQARQALECLPLNRDEFATATNRLANAHSYLDRGERGAALFELRLLSRSLVAKPSSIRP
jgi:hypothetical protein